MSGVVDVATEVRAILAAYEDDPEAGHGMEDELLEWIVRACASGEPWAREAAVEVVLGLLGVERTRWYA